MKPVWGFGLGPIPASRYLLAVPIGATLAQPFVSERLAPATREIATCRDFARERAIAAVIVHPRRPSYRTSR